MYHSMCVIHRKKLVPMMLLSTIEQPEGLIARGKSCLVQARYVICTIYHYNTFCVEFAIQKKDPLESKMPSMSARYC